MTRSRRTAFIGFMVGPGVSLVASFAALPVLARNSSSAEWAALGVGQSTGALLALAALLGFPLVGPPSVRGLAGPPANAIYLESLKLRSLSVTAFTPAAVLLAACAVSTDRALAAVAAIGGLCAALSPAWLATGLGSPKILLRYDVLPKAVTNVGIALLISGGVAPVALYPIGSIATSLVLATTTVYVFRSGRHRSADEPRGPSFRELAPAALTMTLAGFYTSATVLLVGSVSVAETTAEFSSANRLYALALQAVIILSQTTRSWAVPNPSLKQTDTRLALKLFAALAVTGGIAFSTFGPKASTLLFGSEHDITFQAAFGFGIAFASVCMSTFASTQVLLPTGSSKSILACTGLGSALGVPMILVGAKSGGVEGAALAFGAVEAAVALLVGVLAFRKLHARG